MRIVALDGGTLNPGDNPWTALIQLGDFVAHERTGAADVIARSQDAEILLTNKVVLNDDILAQLPRLKFIAVTATGFNVIDLAAAAKHEILVSNVPVYSTQSVSQHVFTGLLALLNRPEMHDQAIREGEWQHTGQFSFWKMGLTELAGKTLGIVGLGRIGRSVAQIANAFGMTVVAHSRSQNDPLSYDGFEWSNLDDLFSRADVISLHCPQTDQNVGFVDQRLLGLMKPTAIFINTARGGLVNESDLATALNSELLAGAFLDVVSAEPISHQNPLFTAKNCLLTPHIGWATLESRRRLMQMTAENVAAFIDGRPINLISCKS